MVACHAIHDCFILGAVCSSIHPSLCSIHHLIHRGFLIPRTSYNIFVIWGHVTAQDGWRLLWLERESETKWDVFANTDEILLNLTYYVRNGILAYCILRSLYCVLHTVFKKEACIDFRIWNNNCLILKQALFFLHHISCLRTAALLFWNVNSVAAFKGLGHLKTSPRKK